MTTRMPSVHQDGARTRATLGLGTAVFLPGYGVSGQGVSDPIALLTKAFHNGIAYVDTAAGYASSEHWLGDVRDVVDTSGIRICTKLTARELPDGIPGCLSRLRIAQVDTMLAHSADLSDIAGPAIAAAFDDAKAAGLIRLAGASTYGADNALAAVAQPWCDCVQVEFSILNPSVVRALTHHRHRDQEVVVRSVLAQGMLTSSPVRASRVSPDAAAVINRLEETGAEWGLSLEQLAIRFALDTVGIDVVLVGVANEHELDVALQAAAVPRLTEEQLATLAEFDRSTEDWTHPERWTRTP